MATTKEDLILEEVRGTRRAVEKYHDENLKEHKEMWAHISSLREDRAALKVKTSLTAKVTAAVASVAIAIGAALWMLLRQ